VQDSQSPGAGLGTPWSKPSVKSRVKSETVIFPQIENEIKEEQKVEIALSECHAKLSDIFSTQRKREDDMIAEKHSLSKR